MSSAQSFVESFPHLAPRTINGDASPSAPSSSISAPLVQPILTPRMAISCTPELLTSLSDLAKQYDPPLAIQTHLDENLLEIEFVSKLFPDSSSYTAVYDDFGLLGPGTILAHCVHLTQEERTLIAQRGAGVSHCPTSNFYIDSGCARVREMLEDGIKVSPNHVPPCTMLISGRTRQRLLRRPLALPPPRPAPRLAGLEPDITPLQGHLHPAYRRRGVLPRYHGRREPVQDTRSRRQFPARKGI